MEVTDAIHDFNPLFRTAEKIQPKTIISAEHVFLSLEKTYIFWGGESKNMFSMFLGKSFFQGQPIF